MDDETTAIKRPIDAVSASRKCRPNVAFDASEMAIVEAAAERAHLPVATYIRVTVLRDAEGSR